ncbi:HDOD domain-containing protein [Geodermatophilus sp. Leaf369]|uniref:HDOD domain-containing protein n=1 Tax=Geodermatophilus sp. Leaf369 TaxID=1736354 RepID=UPI001F32A1F7|nr:HDOD domain-containing protein [Geodermatophilus sp. Leaf369]
MSGEEVLTDEMVTDEVPTDEEEGPAPLTSVGSHSVDDVLASIETMAAQRPIAAQIVALTDSDHTGAKEVARLLSADPALSGRVLKLANSAYYGMRGRVSSLQFGITVVGFAVVRSMATVALTGTEESAELPEDFWTVSTHLALAASALAPRMGRRPADALCVGLLAQLGVALLSHHDPVGYAEVRASGTTPAARRPAEVARYGVDTLELTAVAMHRWGFPDALADPLLELDDPTSAAGGLLRGALELTSRLTVPGHSRERIEGLTCRRVTETDLPPLLAEVRTGAAELRRALVG